MRPIAPVDRELRIEGAGNVALGVLGLCASVAFGTSPGRAVISFAVAMAALMLVQRMIGYRWFRSAAAAAAAPDPGATLEAPADTLRRSVLKLTMPLILIVAMLVWRAPLGAVIGGAFAGIGAVDLATQRWAAATRAAGTIVYRELGASPFSGGRRRIYTRPTADITDAT